MISVAASVRLAELAAEAAPARVVRALPLSCAAVNASPTLLCPDDPQARMAFEPLGTVHTLADEEQFVRASVISAFYGWVYALLDETVAWTTAGGVPPTLARSLALETVRGAAGLALADDRAAADGYPGRPGDSRRDYAPWADRPAPARGLDRLDRRPGCRVRAVERGIPVRGEDQMAASTTRSALNALLRPQNQGSLLTG